VAGHIFQARPVWIYTQSNTTSIIFTLVHNTNTEKIILRILDYIGIEGSGFCSEISLSRIVLTA
jgi:hypothetical protein